MSALPAFSKNIVADESCVRLPPNFPSFFPTFFPKYLFRSLMRGLSAGNLYKSPSEAAMAPATVLFQKRLFIRLWFLWPSYRSCIETLLLARCFLPNIPHILWCFPKTRCHQRDVCAGLLLSNMKAAIVMCALVFVFPKNEHNDLHVCALCLGFLQTHRGTF